MRCGMSGISKRKKRYMQEPGKAGRYRGNHLLLLIGLLSCLFSVVRFPVLFPLLLSWFDFGRNDIILGRVSYWLGMGTGRTFTI